MQRVLLAEDDHDLRELTCALLGESAQVDAAGKMAPALRLMTENHYDLLVTDLHIEHAGDGLTLANAMRALQPQARTVLLTGYPDFTRALASMQSTLDQILIKPVDSATLRGLTTKIAQGRLHPIRKMTLCDLLRRRGTDVMSNWLQFVESDPVLGAIQCSPADRLDHLTNLVEGLAHPRDRPEIEAAAARQHGLTRRAQAYHAEWLFLEMSYLRRAIFDVVLGELLEVDLSNFPREMFEINLRLDADLLESISAFGLKQI